mmetsp:Transcript_68023/g.100953  ORF Transcript_68023/g.100953 Transcript_68023/m.100953 type:complete len:587 (+) Transcript_68023:90-1850(+)
MKCKLYLHAKNLPNVAGLFKGKSDPYAVVKVVKKNQPAIEVGVTEVIKNTLDPRWIHPFIFEHELGTPMFLSIAVMDKIPKETDKPMGSAMLDVDSILGAKGNIKAKKMKGGGIIYAKVTPHTGMGDFNVQLRGVKLKNVEGLFKKSDPFYEVLHLNDGNWDTVYRSEPVMDDLNPTWREAKVDLAILCDGKLASPIRIRIYDFEKKGDHELMGEFETSVEGLISARAFAAGGDVNDTESAAAFNVTKKGRDAGQIFVMRADISGVEEPAEEREAEEAPPAEEEAPPAAAAPAFVPAVAAPPTYAPAVAAPPAFAAYTPGAYVPPPPKPTFVDYVAGGCEINLGIAIDYSASNGDPRQPGTPHYFSGIEKNDYEAAIASVGKVLGSYDSDHLHSVWGFGAKYGGIMRNIFQCGPAPEVNGVEGILDAYRSTFKTGLAMSEPTDISEVVEAAAAKASQAQSAGGQSYSIMLILTDGQITDVNKAAASIFKCSKCPMSIVIIGVGNGDFRAMNFLDDMKCGRDIVQFVPFNQYRDNLHALSKAVLKEVPGQLVEYFQMHGIQPNPPVQQNEDEITFDEEDDGVIEFSF